MRICWISSLLLGLCYSSLLPYTKGLEGEKKIGVDDVYKPRKWSQVRDGPYRMVVSSRVDDSSKATRNGQEEIDEDNESKKDVTKAASEANEETQAGNDQKSSRQQNESPINSDNEAAEGAPKSRGVERRKHKVKLEQTENPASSLDGFEKSEKSTQRTVKLGRKRERILLNENFRKAHRVSIPEGYFSTSNPSTLSYKVYNHFRPIERGIPRESIIPFYDFGKKLSTGKTPSGINSIEGSSTPGLSGYEMTTHREDDEPRHENIDKSVVKLRGMEKNLAPRSWPPLKNSEISAYIQTSPSSISDDVIKVDTTTSLPLEEETKAYLITTQSATSTAPSTDSTTTIVPTILPAEQSDLQTYESKAKTKVISSDHNSASELPSPVEILTNNENKTSSELLRESTSVSRNLSDSSPIPQPSPTAKILSTAVVTSVSVKETYRHPRIKGVNSPDVETNLHNKSVPLSNKTQDVKKTENITSFEQHLKPESVNIVPSTHRPSLERIVINRTVPLYKNNSIQPTTIRPKFKSNIEFHTFTTKVPTSTTTHKPVNRSLYSTVQREQQKNKFVSSQHHRNESSIRTVSSAIQDNSSYTESKTSVNANENKTKMYLTIRSRLPNQSATFRSTYRRNSTKAVPPVLRVIATPSSYIEVPRIISRLLQNSSTTTQAPSTKMDTSETEPPDRIPTRPNHSYDSSDQPKTDIVHSYTTTKPKNDPIPKNPDNQRETRMNNHRMSSQETTTQDDSSVGEMTTLYFLHPLETTTETSQFLETNVGSVPQRPGHTKPGLSWVHLGQKNRSRHHDSAVELAYANGFGIAAYVLATLGVIPLILGGFVLLRQIFIKSKKKMLDESEYSSEYNRTPLPAKLPRIPSHAGNWEGEKPVSSSQSPAAQQSSNQGIVQHQNNTTNVHHQINQHASDQNQVQHGKWEFPRDKLRLQTLLGEGNFGQVWKAEADDISGHEGLTRLVAVKTVKEGSGGREKEDLLRELAIMQELGSHPNVVTLLGCCTDREPFLLIMEYVMYGKMLTFLREHRTRAHYFNFSDLNSALVSRDLTVFAYCVARGMEFIVSKGIIHRDLAARNILVDHNKLCKIADFGMSRNVQDSGEIYEQRPNRGALPIRWMAPEALHCSIFTHKSDVWSFGILVWEIITLGCTPYQTMGAREVMRRVREGYRLERPVHCSQDLYKVITRCWAADSTKRPTFTDLKHDLATLLSDPQTNGACVDLDALTEEMSSHSC